jgi:uncharacterized protein YceH (UPF0502 family)
MQIDRTARRVLGSLIEKRWTTPEQYPLTANALLLACNQKSNRDPEMQLEEFLLSGCLQQLRLAGLVSIVERDVGRAVRYAERLSEQLDLTRQQQAVAAELMLRGPQTAHELLRRCERMAHFENEGEVESVLSGMAERQWLRLLPCETGQRHQRWTHLFAPPDETADAPAAAPEPDLSATQQMLESIVRPATAPPGSPDLRAELLALREEVAELRARVARLEGADGGRGDAVPRTS